MYGPETGAGPFVEDRRLTLTFSRFVRDIESSSRRLDDSSHNTTVLAPLNSAIEKLPRKPWEDPRDYNALGPNAYEGGDGQERAQRNLRRFVEAHMVPVSPWREGEKAKPIGDDQEIWWEEKDGTRMVSSADQSIAPSNPPWLTLEHRFSPVLLRS